MALSGSDVIGQAKTGTGKTLGFGLPLLERVTVLADVEAGRAKPEELTDSPQALIVVPTRELCQQVTNDLLTMRQGAQRPGPRDLRRPCLRAPGRGPQEGRRRDRRHPR